MKNKRISISCRLIVMALLFPLLLSYGCGSSESDPGVAVAPATADYSLADLSYVDLSDTNTTKINLGTSADYDAANGLAKVFAIVNDQDGNFIDNLNAYNFTLVFDPLMSEVFADPADVVISKTNSSERYVALIIDVSGSMDTTASDVGSGPTRMEVAKSSAQLFLDSMRPGDKTAIIKFESSASTVQALTDDKGKLASAIDGLSPDGGTNIGAGIKEAVNAIGYRPGKRVAILLTDGDDNGGIIDEGIQEAQEAGMLVYTIGMGTGISETGLDDLRDIADQTDGEFYQAAEASALSTVFASEIPNALNSLPAVTSYLLEAPNYYSPLGGVERVVGVTVSVQYEGSNGNFVDTDSATYTVTP